ncbi:hypothetical protein HY029_06060 [Candidatus Gottesmanbacteria bacterium]|nr:hypothetical protein [Candidatus Gottesmanbacteria bacterium]
MSCYLIHFTWAYSHQYMGMMLMPLFFYTFIQYIKTLNAKYLASNVFLGGMLIQFEIAYGGPLSFIFLLFVLLKNKKFLHILLFGLILIPLSTYIMFDLRHNFMLLKSLQVYMKGNPQEHYVSILSIIKNRFEYMTSSAVPLLWDLPNSNKILAVLVLGFLLKLASFNKVDNKYKYFFYFFFGYFLFSLTNRYYLLSQHFLGFIPIVIMMIASLVTSRYAKYIVILFLFIMLNNEVEAIKFVAASNNIIGFAERSWKFYDTLSQKAFTAGSEKEFGYFVWTPDKFAYSPRYAMVYGQKTHPDKIAYSFTKKPVTYLVMAPPPKEDPWVDGKFWKVHSIVIDKKPVSVISFPNGYRIDRYELTDKEVATPFDPTQDMGIHFR